MRLTVPQVFGAHQALIELIEERGTAAWALWCLRTLKTIEAEAVTLQETAMRLRDDPTQLDALNQQTVDVHVEPYTIEAPDGTPVSALDGVRISALQILRLGPLLDGFNEVNDGDRTDGHRIR